MTETAPAVSPAAPAATTPLQRVTGRLANWLDAPLPAVRIEFIRVFAPLWVLGFMSSRLIHADEWIGEAGFRVPILPHGVHQPLWIPPLPNDLAWLVVTAMVVSGLFASAGYKTKPSLLVFISTLVFCTLSDRPSAFTVSKISPVISIALFLSPVTGSRFSVDAWQRLRKGGELGPKTAPLAPVHFLQAFLSVFYCASGIAKAGSDWLTTPLVLFSHLHDSYQTIVSFTMAQYVPGALWTPMQYTVLVYEMGSPILFGWRRTRFPQMLYGISMHVGIGIMFGPVIWFALLMISLLLGCYSPDSWAWAADRWALRIMEKGRPTAGAIVAAEAPAGTENAPADPAATGDALPHPRE